jgi:hypothetical protein
MQLHFFGGSDGEYFNILGPKFNAEQRGLQHVGVSFFDGTTFSTSVIKN